MQARHCPACGAAFADGAGWPRACAHCTHVSYWNPLPVAVVVQPVDDGLLMIRRAIPPVGKLALPGGFIDGAEPWQAAAARELREETNLVIDPATVRELPFFLCSSPPASRRPPRSRALPSKHDVPASPPPPRSPTTASRRE
jgi:8-oxo-dGTP pyrophosphatase MutT (NUDIX family)